ncbi:MAG TPA: hypothetical protein VGZ49_00015 [Xanthobacteraceae bacterium]|jgi:hypothetical protein|nr:hypothetical protein [Xanthobacteraceae bacterium]
MPRKAVLAAILLVASSAFAMAESGTPQERAACRPDVAKHCRGLDADKESAFLDCLVSHAPELTPRCRAVLQDHGHLPKG